MKIGQQIKFLVINKRANSLYALIADGKYRATSLGRNTWKTLIGSQASLQANCKKEGFNAAGSHKGSSKARIGIPGNNEKDCTTTNSRIGFGTGGYHDDSNTCGNYAIHQITEERILKQWDTSWFSRVKTTRALLCKRGIDEIKKKSLIIC